MIIDSLQDIQKLLSDHFNSTGDPVVEPDMAEFDYKGWNNLVWQSEDYRRAHLEHIEVKGNDDEVRFGIIHCCIFPHFNNDSPIWGFDVVAGKNKITGCFYDFSPTVDVNHPMINWFANSTGSLSWARTRILPEWATNIFSKHIVAAGNVKEEAECSQIFDMVEEGVSYYLNHVGHYNDAFVYDTYGKDAQNRYCFWQKQNPHVTKSLESSLGLSDKQAERFVENCLFPEVK